VNEQDAQQWREQRLTHWFTESWAKGAREILAPLDMKSSGEFRFSPAETPEEGWGGWQAPVWLELPADLAEGASLFVGSPGETVRAVAAVLTGESEPGREAAVESYREFVEQVASAVSKPTASELGTGLRFADAQPAQGPPAPELGVAFSFDLEGRSRSLAAVPTEAFVEALLHPPEPEERTPEQEAPQAEDEGGPASPGAEGGRPAEPDAARGAGADLPLTENARHNLRMLLDIELDLSVSFGKTELPLHEVLKLSSGAIVELNRSANDPVEVLVNDRVIARGEVVVVDGNYGIRITEVVSRQARIDSIF